MNIIKNTLGNGHSKRPFSVSQYRKGQTFKKLGLTIHSTANEASTAKNERSWLDNPDNHRQASYHYVVDSRDLVQVLNDCEEAWDCGNTQGGCYYISLEICESGDRLQTLLNAVEFCVSKCKEYKFTTKEIKKHTDWTKKDCPRILINPAFIKVINGVRLDWAWFINKINAGLKTNTVIVPKPTIITKPIPAKTGTVTATVLNVRKSPISGEVLGQLKKGEIVKLASANNNGWISIFYSDHGGWVSADYIKIN